MKKLIDVKRFFTMLFGFFVASQMTVLAQSITNPSFEDGTNGWTVNKMQLQGNDGMSSYKAGNTYIERWIAAPGLLGCASVKQTVTGLSNGVYRLTVAAMNISQNNENAAQVGAWIVANGLRTLVTTRNTYTLDFFVTDGTADIGFVADGASGNWVGCDNFTLTSLGSSTNTIKSAGNTVKNYANNLINTYGSDSQYSSLVSTLTSAINGGNLNNVANAAKAVVAGERAYRLRHPSGSTPTVTTNKRHARGSIWIFGRLSWSGNDVVEEGFCYSTSPNPTINDNCATDWTDSYGKVIWIQNLTPGTMYYVRAYAMTRGGAVGYGDVIKVPTLPQGDIHWSIRDSGDSGADDHIRSSCAWAFDQWWDNLTQLTTFWPSIGHVSGVPTAECSRGGWCSVGDSWSYQQPGTILHEMLHGVGVGQHWMWGDFVRDQYPVWDVIRFWNNNEWEGLSGDGQHLWPYGINGAHEDNGSDQLYIGNALVCEALGEAGLPLTDSQWLLPYYAFPQDDNTKYYIKCEDKNRGLITSYLVENNDGTLGWQEMSATEAQGNDRAAWYITFDASIQKYHIRNASTSHYIRYNSADANNGFTTGGTATDIQMKKCRVDVNVGSQTYQGYYFIDFASGQAMEAKANGVVGSIGFRIWDDASLQRWLILAQGEEMETFDNAAAQVKVDVLRQLITGYTAVKNVNHTDKLNGATTTFTNTLNAINSAISGTVTMNQVNQYITTLKSAAFTFLKNTKPVNGSYYDLTFLLQNPDFTESANGWSLDPVRNYGAVEFYQTTYDLNQTVADMPAGTYRLVVDAFQRPGANADVYAAYRGGNDNVSAFIYVNDKSQKIKNVMAGAQNSSISNGEYQTSGGTFTPDNMESGSTYLSRNIYTNTLEEEFEAGDLQIGLRCTVSNGAYWTMADNFRLYYLGSDEVDFTFKEQLQADGFTKITELPADYSPYFFVFYDHESDFNLFLSTDTYDGYKRRAWYGSEMPTTRKSALWTLDSYTLDNTEYQVFANATYTDHQFQTDWNAPWQFNTNDNNLWWCRALITYDVGNGYWTVRNGVYPDTNYLGLWNGAGHMGENANTAMNKSGDDIGHYDIFTIPRGAYVNLFDAWNTATYEQPLDISYVLENPGGERRSSIGWKTSGAGWSSQGSTALNGKVGSYFLEAWNANGLGATDLYQEIAGLPDGYYQFSAIAHCSSNCYLYANSEQVAIPTENSGNRTSVIVLISNGATLRVGAKTGSQPGAWIAFDDAHLEYLGTHIPYYTVGTATPSITGNPYMQQLNTVSFNFTEAETDDANATFALLSNNAKAELYTGGTKVGEGTLTLNGKLVTADFTGTQLEGGNNYTITLPAGTVGYAGRAANDNSSMTFKTPAILDGTYYLYNTYTQNYLSRGGQWATACQLDDWGLALIITTNDEGITTLKYFDSQAYLYNDGFCWADGGSGLNFNVTKTGSTYKFLNLNNNRYLAVYGGRAVGDAAEGGNLVGTSNVWALETTAEHVANATTCADAQAAAAASAAGASYITTKEALDAAVSVNNLVSITGASAERYQWYAAQTETNTPSEYYKETVWNLPNGLYRLTVDAFQRAAWFDDVANADGARGSIYVYANDAKTQIKSIMEYGATTAYTGESWADYEYDGIHYPNSITAGFNALNTGNYENVVYVYVTNGTLTFGINNPNRLGNGIYRGTWAIFDNFRLERLSVGAGVKEMNGFDDDATSIEETKQIDNWDNAEVYDMSGRRVQHPSKGFYIVNGKKVFIK